jgi:hypothetical protein
MAGDKKEPAIGALTSENRDIWFEVFSVLWESVSCTTAYFFFAMMLNLGSEQTHCRPSV